MTYDELKSSYEESIEQSMPVFLYDNFSDIVLKSAEILIPENYKIRRITSGNYSSEVSTGVIQKGILTETTIGNLVDSYMTAIANNVMMKGAYMCNASTTPNSNIKELFFRLLYFISNKDVSSIYSTVSSISKETSERYKRYCDLTTKFNNHTAVNTRIKAWKI